MRNGQAARTGAHALQGVEQGIAQQLAQPSTSARERADDDELRAGGDSEDSLAVLRTASLSRSVRQSDRQSVRQSHLCFPPFFRPLLLFLSFSYMLLLKPSNVCHGMACGMLAASLYRMACGMAC